MPPKHHHKHKHGGPGRGHHSPPGSPGRGRGRGRHHHKHHHHSDSDSESSRSSRSRSHSPPHHHKHHHKHDHDHHHPPHHHKHHEDEIAPPPPARKEDEKQEREEDVDVSNLNINDDNNAAKEEVDQPDMGQAEPSTTTDNDKKKKQNNKNQFKVSPKYGGDGGSPFDHGNNKHISKITMFTDGHAVVGIQMMYLNFDGKGPKLVLAGKKEGESQSFNLAKNEFITWAKVRSNKFVQELTFRTNQGNILGPVGGQGWKGGMLSKDKCGEEVEVPGPFKKQLCGIMGGAGTRIDCIAFRWGPVPDKVSNGN